MKNINKLKDIIKNSNNIVLFTGAGISVPSGIPDFRSAEGIYNKEGVRDYTPEEIVSNSFFNKDTKTFYDYYKKNLIFKDAKSNIAHKYFGKLEKEGKLKAVITQNIDNLHQDGGSKNVVELHGSIYRNYCVDCGEFHDLDYIIKSKDIPKCSKCGGVVKPGVVLFEEQLDDNEIARAVDAIKEADTLIVVGSSLIVEPAASLIQFYHGQNLVLINKTRTGYDQAADLIIYGDIIDVIKELEK